MLLPSYKLSLDSLYRPVTNTNFSFSNCSHLRGHNQNERSGQINVQQQKSFQWSEFSFCLLPNRIILHLVISYFLNTARDTFNIAARNVFRLSGVCSLKGWRTMKFNTPQIARQCFNQSHSRILLTSCHSFMSFKQLLFFIFTFFVWIVLLVYCRHLPTDGIFNQKTLKYLHFDIVNESTVWSHLRHFEGSIINRFSSNKMPMGLWIAV